MPRPVPNGNPMRLNNMSVVVVDDHLDSAELLAAILEMCGANVRMTTSATEALAAVEDAEPAVLVSDIAMPERDGYWLLEQVKSKCGASPPVIAVTAHADYHDRQRALRAGFDAYLVKPVDPDELCEAVARVHGRALVED
jgi:two-component system, chemotaxis family, CheB/CheR fusion protein